MNTKGVEDGIDEQAVRQVYPDAWVHPWGEEGSSHAFACCNSRVSHSQLGEGKTESIAWSDARSKLPKPAELELKGEGGDTSMANVKDGGLMSQMVGGPLLSSKTALPSAAVPVEERKTVEMFCEEELWERHSQTMEVIDCDMREERSLMKRKDFSAALDEFINSVRPVPERTAEMEQLIEAARALVGSMETCHICKVLLVLSDDPTRCEDCSYDCEGHDEPECAPIYELHRKLKATLDHIEGKAKAVSREVKE